MPYPRWLSSAFLVLSLGQFAAAQQPAAQKPTSPPSAEKLKFSGLPPSKLIPGLCLVKYRISTASPECQAFFDQGLGYFYSYVWMEAARSFETALRHDPDCAMAWWGLSRALDKWPRNTHTDALKKAQELMSRASDREQMLITARLQEKGLAAGAGATIPERKKAAAKTLDELLTLYDDDQEGWYNRAQVVDGPDVGRIPYYKALLRLEPLHPGANHELVHFYENYRRPALGWVYAENYIRSSPRIPHPFHMQAHLATRLGRWDRSADWSAQAIVLERQYHRDMEVKPREDHQFSHHLEILLRSLIHDGRFTEARAIKKETLDAGLRHLMPWFSLHLAERDWAEARKIIEMQKKDKNAVSYLEALICLEQGDTSRAEAHVDVLREAYTASKTNKDLELRLWETQGVLMCQLGDADAGLKLIQRAVDKLKNDYRHHAWGNGAYYMEKWGIAALRADRLAVAEEAFLEALAHDPGSVRGALGMQVLCERQGRTQEAARFDRLAQRCWRRADSGRLEQELAWLRGQEGNHETHEKHEKGKERIP